MIFLRTFIVHNHIVSYIFPFNNKDCIKPMSSIKITPLALLDKCIGERLWLVMKSKRQFAGIIRGFDDFLNMVLENVTQIWHQGEQRKSRQIQMLLLNGHDIAFMVPGTNPTQKVEQKKVGDKSKS